MHKTGTWSKFVSHRPEKGQKQHTAALAVPAEKENITFFEGKCAWTNQRTDIRDTYTIREKNETLRR